MTNNLFNQLREEAINNGEFNTSYTENGALGFRTSGKELVDFDNGYEEARDKEHLRYFDSDSNKYAFFFKLIFEIIEYY